MVVGVPSHIVVRLEDKALGADEGGVFSAIVVIIPPAVVVLHAPVPRNCNQ
jgi:hypothetical protein